mmetsp:Transcript_25410/g.39201  ORF Transcript_25410/g.39201 Transcript_25410/m.39201 type:complete len:101 (-) Transcript_25410:445-747(-)
MAVSKLRKNVNKVMMAQSLTKVVSTKKKIAQVCWRIAKETAKVHLSTATISFYERTFEHLMNYSGKKTIEEVVQEFRDAEDQNLQLQREINEIDYEIEDV